MKDLDSDLTGVIPTDTDDEGNYLDFTFDEEESSVQLTDEGMDLKVEATVKYHQGPDRRKTGLLSSLKTRRIPPQIRAWKDLWSCLFRGKSLHTFHY